MKTIETVEMKDLDKLVNIDKEVIGNDQRRNYIKKAIELRQCLCAKENEEIVGFLIYNTNFFECVFISLVIISPSHRRKGYASLLLKYMMSISPTTKVFSSTNRSNIIMRKVFEKNGFIQSGITEN